MTGTQMYNWRVAAIQNALAERGKAEGPLTIDDLISLGHLDQYHYFGVEACDHLAKMLGLDATSRLLDIGSGVGGPARYLAARTGCSVVGVELQADLTEAAAELTSRVGLSDRVRFVVGDFVDKHREGHGDLAAVSFDHFISQLVFLHIPQRKPLLDACFSSLKPGGTFLIEDFAQVGASFTAEEERQLKTGVHAHCVTPVSEYIGALEAAGFVDVEAEDLTKPWAEWSLARYESYVASKDDTVKMHGEALYSERSAFYKVVSDLFQGGNLGGVRLTGRRRGTTEEKLFRGRSHASAAGAPTKAAVLNEYGSTVRSA
jgi:cyclopropane fatty-acyl-phospholipid synthase-like methyltransferase